MGARMQPIRDMNTVHDIEVTLSRQKDRRGRRIFLMWEVGIRLGLRVSDLIELRVGDLRGQKSYTYLPIKQRNKKGARPITITIDPRLREVLRVRCQGMDDSEWLFPSQKKTAGGNPKHISRQQARDDMQRIAKLCGLTEAIGCHTMRKTFGYHYYQRNHDVAILQSWFYHETPATTLVYIGVSEDNFRKMTDRTPFDNPEGVVL